jgi:Fibronectin type III domain
LQQIAWVGINLRPSHGGPAESEADYRNEGLTKRHGRRLWVTLAFGYWFSWLRGPGRFDRAGGRPKEFPSWTKELPQRVKPVLDAPVLSNTARMIFSEKGKKCRPKRPLSRGEAWAGLVVGFLTCVALGVVVVPLARAANPIQTSVKLVWDPSPDASVTGYRIHYGVASEQYTNSIVVGNLTSDTVPGLVSGVTYYFAITAYDATGMQSPFSNEISYQLAFSQMELRANAARQMILTVTGQSGHIYDIEATQNLTTWAVIGVVAPGAGGIIEFTDASAASYAKRFYRVRDTTPWSKNRNVAFNFRASLPKEKPWPVILVKDAGVGFASTCWRRYVLVTGAGISLASSESFAEADRISSSSWHSSKIEDETIGRCES